MTQGTRGDLEFTTIPRLAQISAERYPDGIAIEDGTTHLSFPQLLDLARQVTAGLIAQGVSPGDRVAIWAPNMWEWVVCALGLQGAGAALVPLNTRYKGPEAAWILSKSGAVALLTVSGFLGHDYVSMLDGEDLPDLRLTVILRGAVPEGCMSLDTLRDTGTSVAPETLDVRWNGVASDDLCDILFTSGTTGRPKGAMTTHAQTLRAFRDWSDVVGLSSTDRYLVVAPFFHGFGYKAGWLAALMMGATVIPQPTFDVGAVLARIAPDRITVLPGPPALYQTFLARTDLADHDLSTLRLAVTGAAVIPVELIEQMRTVLGFQTVITGYGLTEATAIATMCRYDDDPTTIATTSGRAIPGVEVAVLDDAGTPLPPGAPGEVVIRGYNVMLGYLDEPEETAATVDAEGWLHTGDIGVMNERGYIRITDRKKDMFIVGGFNAYPAEIDNAIRLHEQVADVAVIGVPDDRLGEVGVAFVVATPGATLTETELVAWCRARMANFKVPRQVTFLDALPRNAVGKVQKFKLRDGQAEG
ncbi:MAG: acyl-CoA synthetase (AMP-forming)/AMP-acid ligase II [Myxococcota bacterium]|jgi:acyl-CoA synthetase (AMP-forming)/AMP-acid ligase II